MLGQTCASSVRMLGHPFFRTGGSPLARAARLFGNARSFPIGGGRKRAFIRSLERQMLGHSSLCAFASLLYFRTHDLSILYFAQTGGHFFVRSFNSIDYMTKTAEYLRYFGGFTRDMFLRFARGAFKFFSVRAEPAAVRFSVLFTEKRTEKAGQLSSRFCEHTMRRLGDSLSSPGCSSRRSRSYKSVSGR